MDQNIQLLQNFVNLYTRIEDMGSNFNRDRLQEYTDLYDKMNKCAVEIVRADACPYYLNGSDILVLEIDDKKYELKVDDVFSHMETAEFKAILAKQLERDKEEERRKRREENNQMNTNGFGANQNAQQNPFDAMARYFMAPFMSMAGKMPPIPIPEPRETTLSEDLATIQRKVIALEERSKIAAENAEKVGQLETEVADLKEKYTTLSKEKDEMEELWSSAVEENDKYKKQVKSFDDYKNSTRGEIKRLNEKVKELQDAAANTNADEIKAVQDENEKLKASLAAAEDKLVGLTKENAALANKKSDETTAEKVNDLKEEIKKYKALAYSDQKYGVMNANAYHHFLETCEKDKVTVSVCGICNTKQINQLYGRAHGDRVIESVAKKLVELFGKENIYRIYGDQFFILTKNGDSSDIKRQLTALQSELFNDMVSVAFGVIDAVTCDSMEQAVKQAEGDMNSMKVKNGHKQIVSKELARMKEEMDATNTEAPAEDVAEDQSEIDTAKEVEVLSETMIQDMGEPEIHVESTVSSEAQQSDALFDAFE